MRVAILDDYFDTLRTLPCFAILDGHDVTVWTDHVEDVDVLAARLAGVEALVLISERSVYAHIDVEACTRHGVVVSSNMHPGTPSYAAAELTWGLMLSAARQI